MESKQIDPTIDWSPLEYKLRDLGPWHFEMKVPDTGKLTTDYHIANVEKKVRNVVNPHSMANLFKSISPDIFKDKTFMDIGCNACLLYTSPSPRDATLSRMPSSA